MASGITAALNYIMAFLTTKTYYNIETSISLFGLIAFYAVVDVFGLVYIYMFLPETGMCVFACNYVERSFFRTQCLKQNYYFQNEELLKKLNYTSVTTAKK